MRRLLSLPLLAFTLAACQDATQPTAPNALTEISDALHNAGNPHFFWLPPVVKDPGSFNGAFDGSLLADLEVRVCEWTGSACVTPLLVTFTSTTGSGSEVLRIDPVAESYLVNWHTNDFDLDASKTYRIQVLASGVALGHADVDVVSSGSQLKNVDTDEYIALKDGRTLVIKFRVEVFDLDGRLYSSPGGKIRIFRVRGFNDFSLEQTIEYVSDYGHNPHGIAFDASGTLYVGTVGRLDILDGGFNILGQAAVQDPLSNWLSSVAYRESGQLFACNTFRTPAARMFVFDVSNPSSPVATDIWDIPGTEDAGGRECRGMAFDADGYLWVTAYARLIQLSLDGSGAPTGSAFFHPGGNPFDVGFQPASGRIVYSAVNENFIGVMEPHDPSTRVATITDVCDNSILATGTLTFADTGDLFVGCSNYQGAVTDFVLLPASGIASATGTVTASSLGAVGFEGPDFAAGYIAFLPTGIP